MSDTSSEAQGDSNAASPREHTNNETPSRTTLVNRCFDSVEFIVDALNNGAVPVNGSLNRIAQSTPIIATQPINTKKAVIILPAKQMTKLTYLPLEVLTMIAANLLEDYIETHYLTCCPNLPMRLDIRMREMSFFSARRVNQTMQDACRSAFFQRMAHAYIYRGVPAMEGRIDLEERFTCDFDKAQREILADEQEIAAGLAERRAGRDAAYSTVVHVGHLSQLHLAEFHWAGRLEEIVNGLKSQKRIHAALQEASEEYRMIIHYYD